MIKLSFWRKKEVAVVPKPLQVVSVHVPKTAGTSFRAILQQVYGDDNVVRLDYPLELERIKIDRKVWEENQLPLGVRVIHGHFNAQRLKQRVEIPESARMITWLRHPVDRVISDYFYLQSRLQHFLEQGGHNTTILKKMQRSLFEFASAEVNQNVQSRWLAGTPLSEFTFVGIQEFYDTEVASLSRALGWTKEPNIPQHNITEDRPEVSEAERAQIAALNTKDMVLYEQALQLREQRVATLPRIELISIHVPKTAGTSFYQSLQTVYGPDLSYKVRKKFVPGYLDQHGSLAGNLNGNIRAIHGHFTYAQVADLKETTDARVVCWLRNPVDRIISAYVYFISNLTPPVRGRNIYRENKHRKNESLLTYASREDTRNQMSKFLEGIALEDLFFIGLQEQYATDLQELARLMDWPAVVPYQLNVAAHQTKSKLIVDAATRKKLADLNALDVDLYQRALALRNK